MQMPSDKIILQVLALIISCIVMLAAFKLIDHIYEIKYKTKLAELGIDYTKEIDNG